MCTEVKLNILLLSIFVLKTQAFWQLYWNDEFNNTDSIDSDKWDITNEILNCDGNFIQQLNCKTNNSRNLWLFDDTLSIAAVLEKEKYLKQKDYTSAMITTKQSFTFGRFEVRAALPKGDFLRTAMYFVPTKPADYWPKEGQIDLVTNIQTQSFGNGVHLITNSAQYIGKEYITGAKINDFHSYIIEWNETTIVWKFDSIQHLTINLTEKLTNFYNPFVNSFKLVITLGVGGQFFAGVPTEDDVRNWECSLLILDYIRVYKWIDTDFNTILNKIVDRNSSSNICKDIMPHIRPASKLNIPFTTIFSVLSLILLLALIPFVIYLFKRQKRLRINNNDIQQEFYDDIPQPSDNVYYECVKDQEYSDQYENPTENVYTNDLTQNSSINTKSEDYIVMTNKYVHKN